MKKILTIAGLLLMCLSAKSQQINRISNYVYNQLYFNPAASGMYEQQLNVSALNKFQWTGFNGAPMLSVLWADYKTSEKGLSFGAIVDRFGFGASQRIGASINPCYSVLLGYKLRLAMGLRIGADQLSFNPSSLNNVFDDGDEFLGTRAFKQTFLKIGAGFQLRSNKFHFGVASADLFLRDKFHRFNPDSAGFFSRPRNYVFNTDYKLVLNDSYTLLPSAIVYNYRGTQTVVGAGMIFEIKDYFWAGGNYYSNSTVSLSVGTYISSRVRFVYSYELAFSSKLPFNLNSHEVNLLFKMDKLRKGKRNS